MRGTWVGVNRLGHPVGLSSLGFIGIDEVIVEGASALYGKGTSELVTYSTHQFGVILLYIFCFVA